MGERAWGNGGNSPGATSFLAAAASVQNSARCDALSLRRQCRRSAGWSNGRPMPHRSGGGLRGARSVAGIRPTVRSLLPLEAGPFACAAGRDSHGQKTVETRSSVLTSYRSRRRLSAGSLFSSTAEERPRPDGHGQMGRGWDRSRRSAGFAGGAGGHHIEHLLVDADGGLDDLGRQQLAVDQHVQVQHHEPQLAVGVFDHGDAAGHVA